MTSPWTFDDELAAKQCIASKDAAAFSPMQKVAAVAFLHHEQQLSDRAIATLSNMSPSAIRHHLRIAKKLDPALCSYLHFGQLSFGQAKILVGLPSSSQVRQAKLCIAHRWTINQLKAAIAGEAVSESADEARKYYQQLGDRMSEQIGFPVKVSVKGHGPQGKIEIQYFTLDDFDSLCQRLKVHLEND